MKPLSILLMLLVAATGCRPAAKGSSATFYLQLVQANDSALPPTPRSRPVGRKLQKRLQCALKWSRYWEMQRHAMVVLPGRATRERLDSGQTVELEMLNTDQVAVRIYSGGKLIRNRTQPAANAFCIAGARAEDDHPWFIVVRRDPPQEPEAPQ